MDNNQMSISIGDTAKQLGVSVKTVKLSHDQRSETVSFTGIACGADKPLRSHSQTEMKQEVNAKTTSVQLSLDLGSFG